MSILIRGVEMPKEEELLCIRIYPNGKVSIDMDLACKQIATAVPVPPHGRLIDADRFEDDLIKEKTRLVHLSDHSRDFNYMEQAFCVNNAILLAEAQQTILEAEKGE